MSTVSIPIIPEEYDDSVLSRFVPFYDESLAAKDRVETKTEGWDAATIKKNLIEAGLAAYEASRHVSTKESRFIRALTATDGVTLEHQKEYITFILEEKHRDREWNGATGGKFLMQRPWVLSSEDGTRKVSCNMCKMFSREDMNWVDLPDPAPSYGLHWTQRSPHDTGSFSPGSERGFYATVHRTRIAQYHTCGGWRSFQKPEFPILNSLLIVGTNECIASGLPQYHFNEPWCARQVHASHIELEGDVTERGMGLRYFNIMKSGGLPEQMWRVTDSQVRVSMAEVESGKKASMFETIPESWHGVPDYLVTAASAGLKMAEEQARLDALAWREHCQSAIEHREKKDKEGHVWDKADYESEKTVPRSEEMALIKRLPDWPRPAGRSSNRVIEVGS